MSDELQMFYICFSFYSVLATVIACVGTYLND